MDLVCRRGVPGWERQPVGAGSVRRVEGGESPREKGLCQDVSGYDTLSVGRSRFLSHRYRVRSLTSRLLAACSLSCPVSSRIWVT
jgi:hypothetical protein